MADEEKKILKQGGGSIRRVEVQEKMEIPIFAISLSSAIHLLSDTADKKRNVQLRGRGSTSVGQELI